MERIQSLADYLGTSSPPVEPQGPRLEDITDPKQFAEAVLSSHEFRRYIVNALTLGDLPSAITCRLMDYYWGTPVKRVEVKDTTNSLADLSAEQLEEQAMYYVTLARELRKSAAPSEETKSVH